MIRRRAIIGRRVGAGVPATPAASLVFDSTMNIVFDGNSLVAGTGPAQIITRCLAKISPIATYTAVNYVPDATFVGNSPIRYRSDKGILVTNVGVGGQTWAQMNSAATDVDGAFDATKSNILLTWEGTNSLNAGRALSLVIQDATDYVTARRAAHPWAKVFTGTCLPRMNQATDQSLVDADNARLDQYNAYLLANYKAMGFDGVFDVRQAGTYFDMQGDYSIDHFNTMAAAAGTLWYSGDPVSPNVQHIHLNSDGYWYIAKTFIVPLLQAL